MSTSTPLTNIRIADLTNVIAGPVATRVLGHLTCYFVFDRYEKVSMLVLFI